MAVVHDDIGTVPEDLWTASDGASVFRGREWLGLPRWSGDGAGYLVADRTMLPLRVVTDPHGWAGMNLVDVCAGESLDLDAADAMVAEARAAAVPHLLVAAAGYHTVPVGRTDPDALHGLVDAVEALAGDRGTPWGFAHLPAQDEGLLEVLRGRGYRTEVVSANAWLDLPGAGFDDYLTGFQEHRRNRIRQERSRFAASGCTVRTARGQDVEPWLPLAAELEADLQGTHGFQADPGYFLDSAREYLRAFGDRMHVVRADLDGEPVATVGLFTGARDLVVRTLGLRRRDDVRAAAVYFNICYYAVIDLAYRLGVRRICFGPRAWRAKTLRGARLEPLTAALPPEAPAPLRDLLAGTGARSGAALAELSGHRTDLAVTR